jgi:aminomethyltransferase
MSVPETPARPLGRTALYDLHLARGARMVPFAGYDMPVQYAAGVLKEHLWTRSSAGLFDVSHMGQVIVRPKSGRLAGAALALESLVPVDVVGLADGRQRYAVFTSPSGGILDDLMVANRGDHFLLVVNAGCKEADAAHLASHLAEDCHIEPRFERALIALQGPKAEAALAALAPEVSEMRFMDVREVTIADVPCIVSRSGYTGEDGYEIGLAAGHVVGLAERLLADPAVQPIGLGARDSLRLEAGLCLYGSDIATTTSPIEAALEWAIQKVRRPGGPRAGGYPGADRIARELAGGPPRRRRKSATCSP